MDDDQDCFLSEISQIHRHHQMQQRYEDATYTAAHDYDYHGLELKHALIRATRDLESTRSIAQQLAHLLHIATKERDEARRLLLFLLQQQQQQLNPNLEEPPPASSSSPSSSDEEEESAPLLPPPPEESSLPPKGRLVEAVMGAGPLLQTLMLAGPLPEWRHPPPATSTTLEIPAISINRSPSLNSGKRKREEANNSFL